MRHALGLTVLVTLAGCSLFTSLDEYDGDGESADAGTTSETGSSVDAAIDTANGGGDANSADAPAADTPSAKYRAAVLADSPIAYFRFEETSGDKLKDEVGTHTGTTFGTPDLVAPGLFGATDGLLLPNASKSHVRVDGTDARFTNGKFTLEAWVFPKLFKNWQWIIATEQTGSPRNGWSLFGNANANASYELWNNDGALSLYMTAKALVADKWQHLVVTYNGLVLAGYLDGVKVQSVDVTLTFPDAGDLTFGCRLINGAPNECLEGWSLDEIALYAAPLTDQRIKAHYDLGVPK